MSSKKLHPFMTIAKCKTEAEFYSKYPSVEHFQRAHPDAMPKMSQGHMKEGGVILMPGYNPPYANPYTSDRYTPGAGPNTMPSMHQGHMQMGGGVLPFSMPAMTPGQIPVKINQRATTMTDPGAPYAQPVMANGGYADRSGYHFDGNSMVKSKGGTYANGVYFQDGGPYTTLLSPDANNSYGEYAYKRVPKYTDVVSEDIEQYKYGGQHVAIDYDKHLGDVAHYRNGGQVTMPEDDDDIPEFAKGGIMIKPSHVGRFTEYKKRTGKTTDQALQSKDPAVRKMAQFAKNAAGWKKQYGGPSNPFAPSYMALGGNPPSQMSDDDLNDPLMNGSGVSKPQTVTAAGQQGVVQDSQAGWRQGMTDNQANQNINYGAGSTDAYDPTTGNTDSGPGSNNAKQQSTAGQKGQMWNWGANALGNTIAGIASGAMALENRRDERNFARNQMAQTSANGPVYVNVAGHGDKTQQGYTPYAGSQSPAMGYGKFGGQYQQGGWTGAPMPTANNLRGQEYGCPQDMNYQMGGNTTKYTKGSVHELSNEEINNLIRQGYKIDKI